MIYKVIPNNISLRDCKHIAFAINTEGYNDRNFAGKVAESYWPELINCGRKELGTVLSKKINDTTFYALVCYSLQYGWQPDQEKIIRDCLNKIDVYNDYVHVPVIGNSLISEQGGANVERILYGIHNSNKKILLHSNYSTESVLNACKVQSEKLLMKIR